MFSAIAPDHRFETSYGGYGAFTGRLGVAVDRALFYAKGGLAVARKFSSGPRESRNYDLSFAAAQVTVAEHDSRLGSYIAGTMSLQGRGTEKDLKVAMDYLRHPALLETPGALYHRATILLDENYVKPNKKAAMGLLKKAISVGKPKERAVIQSQELLAELTAK